MGFIANARNIKLNLYVSPKQFHVPTAPDNNFLNKFYNS